VTRAPRIETRGPAATGPRYAGFWLRFAAYLIDGTLLLIVEGVLAVGLIMMGPHEINVVAILYGLVNFALASAALAWAYFALFESSPMQGTVGKYALGLYVTDMSGDPIGFWRATARYWLKLLSSLSVMVGWIVVAFTPRKQALHDLLARTLVLRRPRDMVLSPNAASVNLDEYWDGGRWITAPSVPPKEI